MSKIDMTTLLEKKAKLMQLVNDESKVIELYRRIDELSKKLDETKLKLESVEKKKTDLLTES